MQLKLSKVDDKVPSVFREQGALPVELFTAGGHRHRVLQLEEPVEHTVTDPETIKSG